MKYDTEEARNAFCAGVQNYDEPLTLLEQCFNAAEMNIEFEGRIIGSAQKTVFIYYKENGSLMKQQSIECDSPAMAVKDIAAAVKI
jgi:hypothetical protein